MSQMVILQKTPKEKMEENPKLPYFRMVLPPKEEGGEWIDIGAFWKAKSGNGYSGKISDNAELILKQTQEQQATPSYNKLTDDD